MTNVRGPQQSLCMGGGNLVQMMFRVPKSGEIGMCVSILSYNGGVQFGLVTDKSFVDDPQRIVDRFQPEFEKLLLAVLLSPRGIPLDPEEVQRHLLESMTG